ncbi:Asp-tRNA(Asn)/Glu-tRNA(Gln) amidotransferase subunit GatB [candidate division WWE3 bacterium]|jgi:aspartyl-tRNA(Asn)/glutamyl-tRNA(Gln) amidotransferase subunit B|nr:Asp-tRNA(Asn)/Glu-tRNA(Gln) amidotransferase subunit GatB [candidate division WWE3 bacterium]MBT7349391.1 Asp-tRNA(Asn)/Glu-tRNA(Gln) amidotransferase subunit GatB [candidate division WWE3 bacterium]
MSDINELLGEYKLVLGLEIHLHVRTKRKMFCRCDANIYGEAPNSHTCPTCLGLPGALPVPNESAVRKAQLLGLALGCSLNENSRFDRKHYSYPDLPKGYQISQYLQPLCLGGFIELSSGEKAAIERIHLEEDTAKSIHKDGVTMIDFNKSSMPLVEIVTEPIFKTIDDAVEFSKIIQDTVRILDIGDVDMEKGQMRLEANISLRTSEMAREGELPNYKVEIKNINSFRFMERAVKAEISRQRAILEGGGTPLQENRGFDESRNETVAQRSKEQAHDYRYFPEPDIPPMVFSEEYIEDLGKLLPELPADIRSRLVKQYQLSEKNAQSLTMGSGLGLLERFEEIVALNVDPEKVANLLINKLDYKDLSSEEFVEKMGDDENKLDNEEELSTIIKDVISGNPDAVEDYKKGKDTAVQFLLGQVMRATKGKAEPHVTQKLIVKHLS